jgi:uncharacterized YigZ family protein
MPIVPYKSGRYEYEEKRSRFIGVCEPVETETEALSVIGRERALYDGASHHVYAYIASSDKDGTDPNHTRFSDDGEPRGTAGMPVLNVFTKNEVTCFVCVVTRYFGGTLLGAGGLARAYSRTAKGSLDDAGFGPRIEIYNYLAECPYSKIEHMKYLLDKSGLELVSIDYAEKCEAVIAVPETMEKDFFEIAEKAILKIERI